MCVADRQDRAVAIERFDEPDEQIVIMHLRRAITATVAARHGVLLLDRAEQIPWRSIFHVPLHIPDEDLHRCLPPEVQRMTATPDQIPMEVRLHPE
ncbi:hypothetical protein [Nocardiopsis ganjiahuensis]|uniref:hypothetical protein n=1 Tax=Nocardiopsis ganjiahuensis TaxID=239984 RepID=UPI000344A9A5|nr:hypothetical protein [Nocardiopsis ganjiahuensis]